MLFLYFIEEAFYFLLFHLFFLLFRFMFKLREKEKILLVLQRHPLILKIKVFPFALVFIGSLVFVFILPFLSIHESEGVAFIFEHVGEFNVLLYLFFLCFFILFLFWQCIFVVMFSYFFDCWIITNQRTIHTELHGLFNRYVSSVYHDRIQDISVDVKGVLPTFFNYGNLQIQTAGKFREFVFQDIPDPYKVKRMLTKIHRKRSS